MVWFTAGPTRAGTQVLNNSCALKNLMSGPSGWKCTQATCRGTSEVTGKGTSPECMSTEQKQKTPASLTAWRFLPTSHCHPLAPRPGSIHHPVLLVPFHLPLLLVKGLSGVCPSPSSMRAETVFSHRVLRALQAPGPSLYLLQDRQGKGGQDPSEYESSCRIVYPSNLPLGY